jgi:hypothetical protein
MITMGQRWMSALIGWVPGLKHYLTPRVVFSNCTEYDQVHRILPTKCAICRYAVSKDEKAVKELVFKCDDRGCDCHKPLGAISHQVCFLCYDLFHVLYCNYRMKNRNYFRELDDKDKDDPEKRRRMGL